METPLINQELFIENSPVKEDTVITKFVPYIAEAQLMYLEELLGLPLYAELQAQIKLNALSPANKALIKIIAPALSHYAVYLGLPWHWAAIVNKGFTVRESENSKAVDINDLGQMRRWVMDTANFFLRRLIKYLCSCRAQYPTWQAGDNCGGGCGKESFKDDFAGFYLP